jgi:2-haloacid dehalogenase
MMVAAHPDDLKMAQACGLRTAFVPRPLEYGPAGEAQNSMDMDFDLVAHDFQDLALQLR